ncbi:MAG: hypothetical protein IJ064_05430 [Bacteroidaceae bacterium]|nr:hypothetical protein [Bacteroidaceae bacterium]
MDLPDNIGEAVMRPRKRGLRQQTFVFSLADMRNDANETINAFCETHNVLSIVFSESKGNLVYVIIYKV